MLVVSDLAMLAPGTTYWVPAVTSPVRDWVAVPGCRRGARFLVDAITLMPNLSHFPAFESRGDCLQWIMAHRRGIEDRAPAGRLYAAQLDRWMLGLSAI